MSGTAGRLLVVGASSSGTCGMRDFAGALAPALTAAGTGLDTVWWERDPHWSAARAWRAAARFEARVDAAVRRGEHDAVLWHYSVFEHGLRTAWDLRGLPVYAPGLARTLARGGRPVVVWLHECAYGFSEREWQRKALAAGQRVALRSVVRSASAVVVASAGRERWLRGRRRLPHRPLARIPVCATLPPSRGHSRADGCFRLGVVGFGADDARADVVTGAVAALRGRGHDVRLELLGAPGAGGARADRWRRAAQVSGCGSAVSFSGILPDGDFAARLGAVDALALPHASGPWAGKTTLAAALASAVPVVALDGPERWDLLAQERAVTLAAPDPVALAARIEPLVADPGARARQAGAGRAFFARELSPEVAAERLLSFVAGVTREAA